MSFLALPLFVFVGTVIFGLARSWPKLEQEWRTSRERESSEAAERALENRKRVLASEEHPKLANTRDFVFRGFKYYDSAQAAVEPLGFTMLGDFSLDHAASTRPGFRTFLRVLTSHDRVIVCSIIDATPHLIGMSALEKAHFYFVGAHRRNLKGMSLRTELSDGRYLITSTDIGIPKEELPPEVAKETLPVKTSAAALVRRHRDRVARAMAGTNATAVPIATADDYGQSWVRHSRLTRAWREKVGYAFTQQEQRDFVDSSMPLEKDMANRMIESMRTLENDERRRAS